MASDDATARAQAKSQADAGEGPREHDPAPQAVMAALGAALDRAAEELADDGTRSPADVFRAVAGAVQALAGAPGLLRTLRGLLDVAHPGPDVAREIAQNEELLAELTQRTAEHRNRLAELLRSEDRLHEAQRESAEIADRIDALHRLELVRDRLGELRAQRDALEARTADIARAVADANVEFRGAGGDLVTLGSDLIESLDADAKDSLRRARDVDRRLASRLEERRVVAKQSAAESERLRAELRAAEADAAEAEERLDLAQKEITERLAALRRHAAADRAICDALQMSSNVGGREQQLIPASLTTALDEADQRLAGVDTALAAALRERDRRRRAIQADPPAEQQAPAGDNGTASTTPDLEE